MKQRTAKIFRDRFLSREIGFVVSLGFLAVDLFFRKAHRQYSYRLSLLCLVVLLGQSGCVRHFSDEPIPNVPPSTYFWIYPQSTIATGISKQQLHWWGEDKDGYVGGYLMAFAPGLSVIPSPDTLTYGYTTVTDSVVQFPLRTSNAVFLVAIRAIDNTFGTSLPRGASIRLVPQPYWDVNANGAFDGGDISLPQLTAAMDQKGATQKFPIKNSPPTITYVRDPSNPGQNILPPDTTFTVISFTWQGSDPDGDETIASYRIALNDTSSLGNWLSLPSTATMVTLMVPRTRSDVAGSTVTADVYGGVYPSLRTLGQVPGLRLSGPNRLYVQARDVAGDLSTVLAQPSASKTWFVKKPASRLLVISDYQKDDSLDVKRFYRDRFKEFAGGQLADYDELDIRTGSPAGKAGVLVPSLTVLNPMFVYTLKLYDFVFWYTDQYPSLTVAQFSLFYYSTLGGKVLYTTEFASANDPGGALRDFAPLDSINSVTLPGPGGTPWAGTTRVPKNYQVIPDSTDASGIYPVLNVDSVSVSGAARNLLSVFVRPIYKRADARYIYRLQADTRASSLGPYIGMPAVGVSRNDKRFVFVGFPLHYLNGRANGGQGLASFFQRVFVQEFGL
jgi:hypothetical protein